ncbi:RidA family protein [Dysgonomonas macrotermitis]|uniref:2-iminobutanoate/2-iminopropanoate deaminase n=1 Tax=Dysgonomonas macrotermitis TaxID=1346286 RepID=A0A1M4YJL1_9BACT|nr:RidA family protein [Dysgonomonas macrotermitis]SHF05867.1 2-iminobutanoate/2-iminopropanoate deaminase [Dysgonomonas macrotermitis]
MKKVISTSGAPAAIGPYSQAIEVNGTIYASGQIPIDPSTGEFVSGGIKEQTEQVFKNIKAILAEAGLTTGNIVKTTVLLSDIANFVAMNEVYATQFEGAYPARSAFAVKDLPKGALVEIEVIAVR